MQSFKPVLLSLSVACLALLGACGSNTPSASTTTKPTETAIAKASPAPSMAQPQTKRDNSKQSGQVIESGIYHLELVPEKEENSTHLDFFLQKSDNHDPVSDAKVTAQVQLPDGTQQNLDLTYDAGGKHYTVTLPSKAAGEYKVAILSDIKGEKVNGRFSFKR